MPIDEAILYFCEECHTVSLQGGVCANCENLLQVDFFVPKAELEALRSALAEREARIAMFEEALNSIGISNADEDIEDYKNEWYYTTDAGETLAESLSDALQQTLKLIDNEVYFECFTPDCGNYGMMK